MFNRDLAIAKFVERKALNKGKAVDNSASYAGSPMVYHCRHCEEHTQTLPETHRESPVTVCMACKTLDEHGCLPEAKQAYADAGWDLEALHRKSLVNKAALEASTLAGCFSCLRTFPPSAIVQWVRSGARRDVELTCAVCPLCSVDSVLASSDIDLTKELLTAMNHRWFSLLRAQRDDGAIEDGLAMHDAIVQAAELFERVRNDGWPPGPRDEFDRWLALPVVVRARVAGRTSSD